MDKQSRSVAPRHPRGRPTKYTPAMIKIAEEYLASCGREATELPTVEGLAIRLGVDDERIGDYAKRFPDFSVIVKRLKAQQKNQLMNDGLYGGKEVNAAMSIFLLKANHGMKEADAPNNLTQIIVVRGDTPVKENVKIIDNDAD